MRKNKICILIGTMGIVFCLGSFYSYSILANELVNIFAYDVNQILFPYIMSLTLSPIPMILGGKLSDMGYSKHLMIFGGLIYLIGLLTLSFNLNILIIIVLFGFFGGFGMNFAYAAATSNSVRLFQNNEGLILGLVTASMAAGTIVSSYVGERLISFFGIEKAIIILFIGLLLIHSISTIVLLKNKVVIKEKTQVNTASVNKGYTWKEMIQQKSFFKILLIQIIGVFPGLLVSANIVQMSEHFFLLPVSTSSLLLSMYSLTNSIGEILFGFVSDKLGRKKILSLIFIMMIVLLTLLSLKINVVTYSFMLIIIGLGFGGIMGVIPVLVMEEFGKKNQGINYGIIFMGYAFSGFLAPQIGINMVLKYTTILPIICFIFVLNLIGWIVSLLLKKKKGNDK